MSLVKEFKEFALKGNVMDLAVGVIIGGAFSTIVNSVVKDLIMPVVGVATGGLDFSNKFGSECFTRRVSLGNRRIVRAPHADVLAQSARDFQRYVHGFGTTDVVRITDPQRQAHDGYVHARNSRQFLCTCAPQYPLRVYRLTTSPDKRQM